MPGGKRGKREEDGWECSVCTFRNNHEAFKCDVCDVRKGTSTRKPRLNPALVEQQETVQRFVQAQQAAAFGAAKKHPGVGRPRESAGSPGPDVHNSANSSTSGLSSPSTSTFKPSTGGGRSRGSFHGRRSGCKVGDKRRRPRVDPNSARTLTITVGEVTVVMTDYKILQQPPPTSTTATGSHQGSSTSKTPATTTGLDRSLSSPAGVSDPGKGTGVS